MPLTTTGNRGRGRCTPHARRRGVGHAPLIVLVGAGRIELPTHRLKVCRSATDLRPRLGSAWRVRVVGNRTGRRDSRRGESRWTNGVPPAAEPTPGHTALLRAGRASAAEGQEGRPRGRSPGSMHAGPARGTACAVAVSRCREGRIGRSWGCPLLLPRPRPSGPLRHLGEDEDQDDDEDESSDTDVHVGLLVAPSLARPLDDCGGARSVGPANLPTRAVGPHPAVSRSLTPGTSKA